MKTTRSLWFLGLMALVPFTASANSLLDIYELALENDAQLKADEAAYEAGLENRTLGRAGLLPQIDARVYYSDSNQDTTDNMEDVTQETERENSGWEISLNQPLFNMAAWYNYQRGGTLSELAEVQFGADQQALIVRVAEAYFNVLRAAENLETALAEEKALEQQLEQTRQRYEVGLTAITEVHEAQSVYDSAAAAALQAQGNLGIAYEALEVLTGQPHDAIAPLEEDFPVVSPTPADRHAWVEFALKNNYVLKAAQLNTRASEQTAKAAKSQHLPTLGASATYSDTATEGSQYFGGQIGSIQSDTETEGSSIMLSLNVPLFSGGRTSAERRQANAQYLQARAEQNRTERTVIQSARALHLSVETGVAQVKARQQAIVSAQSALEATQSGYEVGTRNLVEVLLAQRAVYQAERDYQNALYDYIINSFELRQVAGMLTPADVQQIDRSLSHAEMLRRSDFDIN
ncbi:TolC family outer membrane protein [Marinimicrobium sp. C6131]|uniref:TolC family outer membrane protein n=1 Tax=Marinimicrobium sp. C6131 TaxID=3022676 RepID=UPI00223E60F5|nr:TolC family outer membrane protein [Marinimicrobium sp. C6131]UZJ43187.1 TolC family outer membrane protein [Marinimicrobium sp. C6131]